MKPTDRQRLTTRAAALSIASTTTLIVLKLSVGTAIGSVSVTAEAIHSAVDLLAALIAFVSLQMAARPADDNHHFGHGKAENISGAIEGVLIFFAAALIVREALLRLVGGDFLAEPDLGIAVMVVSVVANILVSRYLRRIAYAADSRALEADAAHLSTDVWTSLGVLAGLSLVRITGLHILDPLLALLVAALIIRAAFDVTRRSVVDLLDLTLPREEHVIIQRVLAEHSRRFLSYHRLRSRKSGPQRHIDLHLVFKPNTSIAEAHRLCDELEGHIEDELPETSITIHMEPPGAIDHA